MACILVHKYIHPRFIRIDYILFLVNYLHIIMRKIIQTQVHFIIRFYTNIYLLSNKLYHIKHCIS